MAETKWSIRGEYMESCNCEYLCPCIYTNPQGPATHDHCIAAMVFRIDEGNSGDTRLDGLKFALVIRSGRVMADGNWVFAGVVDESADDAQRRALAAIVGGEAGGPPACPPTIAASAWRCAWSARSSTTPAKTQLPSAITFPERMTSANFRPSSFVSP